MVPHFVIIILAFGLPDCEPKFKIDKINFTENKIKSILYHSLR